MRPPSSSALKIIAFFRLLLKTQTPSFFRQQISIQFHGVSLPAHHAVGLIGPLFVDSLKQLN
jgi:hypothetical protein